MLYGEYIQADDREGILIGQPPAAKLGLKVGDRANLLVNTSNGEVDEQAFTIRGIYSTRTPACDERTLFMPLARAQAITRTEGYASTKIVLAIPATVIINTLVMAVFERAREIGFLSAIGMKGTRIMALFFAESSLLAVGGILMGLVLGGVIQVASLAGRLGGDVSLRKK